MGRTTLICLLDKADPPDHSFITGMLARVLPAAGDVRVQLVVAKGRVQLGIPPARYYRATLLPVLPALPRHGLRRLILLASAHHLLGALIRKAESRKERVSVLVRNDPLLLLAAKLWRRRIDHLVFQSSFPLEETHRRAWKRRFHRAAYRFAGAYADGLLAVSPGGLKRLQSLLPSAKHGEYIPLLCDFSISNMAGHTDVYSNTRVVTRFVYVGTHDVRRQTDMVLRAAVAALEAGATAEFVFIGGRSSEIEKLREVSGVLLHEALGRIQFVPSVPRNYIAQVLRTYDVGLSLIPPMHIYSEASPTKLAEYLGSGLAVIGSMGITLQEEMVRRSGAGRLVSFDSAEIQLAIEEMCRQDLSQLKDNARSYAQQNLGYSGYEEILRRLVGADGR